MTDKKLTKPVGNSNRLTDNEIIKALDGAILNAKKYDSKVWSIEVYKLEIALDLINRLQADNKRLSTLAELGNTRANDYRVMRDRALKAEAEVERLKNILICFMGALGKVRNIDDIESISQIPLMTELNKGIRAEIKAEAYKEFVERLKEHAYLDSGITGFQEMVVDLSDIENIAYELVGEDNA